MKGLLNKIKKMDMEYILGMMGNNIKDIGKMILKMEMEN